MSMTLSEASRLLGIGLGASKAEINNAYRERVKKCHPDANRDAPPDVKKELDKQFKQLVEARKVMMNPSTAAPEPSGMQGEGSGAGGQATRPTTSQIRAGGGAPTRTRPAASQPYSPVRRGNGGSTARTPHRDGYTPRHAASGAAYGQPYRTTQTTTVGAPQAPRSQASTARVPHRDDYASAAAAQSGAARGQARFDADKPPVYNTSTTIHGGVQRIRDDEEYELYKDADRETEKRYKSFSDVFRATPSIIVSILTLVSGIYLLINGLTAPYPPLDITNPGILISIAALIKLLVYDVVPSFYVRRSTSKKIGSLASTGVEMAIVGIVCLVYVLIAGIQMPGAAVPFAVIIMLGALITLAGVLANRSAKKKAEDAATDISYLG